MDLKSIYTTKPFMSGRSQAIRIPKEYQLDDSEVIINRIGDSLVITPKDSVKNTFLMGLKMFSDDFMEDGRPEEISNRRVEL